MPSKPKPKRKSSQPRFCRTQPETPDQAVKLSIALRLIKTEAVQLVKKGVSVNQVASAGCVHPSTIRRWALWDACGRSLSRKPGSGAVAKLSVAEVSQLKEIFKQKETGSASKAAKAFADITGKSISKSTAWRALTSGGRGLPVCQSPTKAKSSPALAQI